MSLALHIQNPGLFTTVQDLGRNGYRRNGLPAAGAMDRYALAVANLLVGNPMDAAGLECTLLGPTVVFKGTGIVAITGGDLGATHNGRPVAPWTSFTVKDGDLLAFAAPSSGCRAYLAVAGGLDLPEVLGGRSTYLRGAVGGLEGRALQKGDRLSSNPTSSGWRWTGTLPTEWQPEANAVARVTLGPQDDYFTPETIAEFFTADFEVTKEADRMGYRLAGPKLTHRDKKEIVSDGVLPGAIQIPGHGQPIVLLADAQTAGGYPKIAAVIEPDLPVFAQARPGDHIRFAHISLDDAVVAMRQQAQRLQAIEAWLQMQRPAPVRRMIVTVQGKRYEVAVQEQQ
ncbi:MAG: biotin-dependent carboxyltransferase family protein [Bacillota bacterium]